MKECIYFLFYILTNIFSFHQDRSEGDEEQRESTRRECQRLRMRITELESVRTALERELATARSLMTGEEETAKQRITKLTQVSHYLKVKEIMEFYTQYSYLGS